MASRHHRSALPLRRHHFHPPGIAGELRHGYQVMIVYKLDCFQGEVPNHLGLFAWVHVQVLDVLQRFFPIVAITELTRRFLYLSFAPRHFFIGDRDQFLGRVRNHF